MVGFFLSINDLLILMMIFYQAWLFKESIFFGKMILFLGSAKLRKWSKAHLIAIFSIFLCGTTSKVKIACTYVFIKDGYKTGVRIIEDFLDENRNIVI